jgi:hypothetical protein
MNIGDQVRLIGIPPNLPLGDADLPTKAVFEKCLGNMFTVVSFNAIGFAELSIDSVTGSRGETIWVEPEFLKIISR